MIRNALKTFEDKKDSGKVGEDRLRMCLKTWGQKLTEDEIDSAFAEIQIDRQGNIDMESLIRLVTGRSQDDKEE